jgi:hypothetical protein
MSERALDELQRMLEQRIATITKPLTTSIAAGVASSDNIDEWERAMTKAILEYHQAAAVIGGADINDAQNGINLSLRATIALQLGYLHDFAEQMRQSANIGQLRGDVGNPAAGYQSPAQIGARAQMYAGAIRGAYFTATTYGLPLPAMPTEGTLCHTNCKCSWDIITLDAENGDYDAYWRRGAKDSCQTCLIRESEWSPVRIRGGILEV